MKRFQLIIILVLLAFTTTPVKAQSNTSTMRPKYPLLDYEFAPFFGHTIMPSNLLHERSSEIHAFELGVALSKFDIEKYHRIFASWYHYSLPYISVDYRFATELEPFTIRSLPNTITPVMLNVGVSGGAGILALIFPLSINGNLALSTDFKDLFVKYEVGFELLQFSVQFGSYINLTKNGTHPGYLSDVYIGTRFTLWYRD
ncbi:MAG: hypothetical protein QNK23_16955 [Crocinitomicaceae bacterium]|nr:hypothetical protein [Crocinitomicaceae bacterium]